MVYRPSLVAIMVLAASTLLMGAACDGRREPAARPADVPSDSRTASPDRAAADSAGATPVRNAALDTRRFSDARRALRRLVLAEDAYFSENGVYTQDVSRIGYHADGETVMRFLWLTREGWGASATHPAIAGRDCVIYVGRGHQPPATAHDVRAATEGVPACDSLPGVTPAPPAARTKSAITRTRPSTTGSSARPAPVPPTNPTAAPAPRPAASPIPDTGNALDAVKPNIQMRVDLRNLVRMQETYLGLQGVYSRRTEPFALQYIWHRGVGVTILSANGAAWSARATHATRPGKSCVIWVGPVSQRPVTDAQKRSPDAPGTPVCDD